MTGRRKLRIAVIGHVEHVSIASVARLPEAGEIVHLDEVVTIAGGGGGLAFFQLNRSPAELYLFSALGNDDSARFVDDRIHATKASIHVAHRDQPHTRDLVLITPEGERTIFVQGEPLHPNLADPLPWDLIDGFDAAYFTAEDPELLRVARRSRVLVVTSRRFDVLARSGIQADVVVGSGVDAREVHELQEYDVPPRALVLTAGSDGGTIRTTKGATHFDAPSVSWPQKGAYGAGDSFAGALTWYAACGLGIDDACAQAAVSATAVLRNLNPLDGQVTLEPP